MADVEFRTAKKSKFSLLSCVGGCNRKILQKKEKRPIKTKTTSCFYGAWNCLRCLMKKKHKSQEIEIVQQESEDKEDLFDLISNLQSNRLNDQRCSLNINTAAKPPDVEKHTASSTEFLDGGVVQQIDSPSLQPVTVPCVGQSTNRTISVDTFKTATESEEDFYDCLDQKCSVSDQNHQPRTGDTCQVQVTQTGGDITPYDTAEENVLPSVGKQIECLKVHQQWSTEFRNMQLDQLEFVSTLGMGGYGRVDLVVLKTDGTKSFALKCLEKRKTVDKNRQKRAYAERKIMLEANCPFIARFYRTFKDQKYVYLMMEACLAGDLSTLLRDRKYFKYFAARFYAGCVILALEYLHNKGIVYRDLKTPNLLLDSQGYVKMVDFGIAKEIGIGCKTWSCCGTPSYMAPETIKEEGHDQAVDLWSLGVLVFEFLSGRQPFRGANQIETYRKILNGIDRVRFPPKIGLNAQSLIKGLCQRKPTERLGNSKNGFAEIKQHRWFMGFNWQGLASKELVPPIILQVHSPTDCRYFGTYSRNTTDPPDETSGWDVDF